MDLINTTNTTTETTTTPAESISTGILKIVVAGHVDHGKSTLLGRLLMDLSCVPLDKVEKSKRICKDRAIQFEPAFLLDALKEEQEQGISIDSARFVLNISGRTILLIDAPGHIEFLKNMTSGASSADLGLLIVDTIDGIQNQTRRHCQVLSLLGITEIIVVINKMDRAGFDQSRFEQLCQQIEIMCAQYHIRCRSFVPVSALMGDNVVTASDTMPWYAGKPLSELLLQASCTFDSALAVSGAEPFRMVLQDVYRFDEERYFSGSVLSGKVRPGAAVYFSPSGKASTIKQIIKFPERDLQQAVAGDAIAITLFDQVFVERGEVISFPYEVPDSASNFSARMVWLTAEPFSQEEQYLLKIGTAETMCRVTLLDHDQKYMPVNGEFLNILISSERTLASENKGPLSQFVLCSKYATVAAGVLKAAGMKTTAAKSENLHVVEYSGERVSREDRERKAGTRGCVLWLTGISGVGKTTLAAELEKRFFEEGRNAVMLDGDSIRHGLSSDLNFTKEGRAENIRRIAHAAKLFLDTGFLVLVACISPYTADRAGARDIIGEDDYLEIFLSCPIEECQRRDPKGLYKLAKTGQIEEFTGVAAPYQAPTSPALRIDTSCVSVSEEVDLVRRLLAERLGI
jgi:bifunctional enzyme CysN/CysC